MNFSLKSRFLLPLLAAFVFVGCIRWTEPPKAEKTDFAPPLDPRSGENPETEVIPTVGKFVVKFETSKGDFVVQVNPEWSPLGAAQFKKLVQLGYYNDNRFFRVMPGFVVQFGIAGDPQLSAQYREDIIQDDPVKASNTRGKVTFATSGKNTRTTQLFINLADNSAGLNPQGFSPFGEVIAGMEVVDAIEAKHGENPAQQMIEAKGNAYLNSKFPDLDYIKTATIISEEPAPPQAPPKAPSSPVLHSHDEVIQQPEEMPPQPKTPPAGDTPATDKPVEQ